MSVLSGRAITAEKFKVTHPKLDLNQPYTSHVDVEFLGLTHQIQTLPNNDAYNYATVTKQFNIGKYRGHIVETIDEMQTQNTRRYSAILTASGAALATTTYTKASSAVELLAALTPQLYDGAFTIKSGDEAQIVGDVRVALTTDIGLIEIAPLTERVLSALPDWKGTITATGAELFAARNSDNSPFLTLVTKTCRVMVIPSVDADKAVKYVQDLNVIWEI